MGCGVYVLAVLGESPSVLTELLWWITVRERRPLAGIEAWGTSGGETLLRGLVQSDSWQRLQDATGPLPCLLPDSTPPDSSYGFRIHTFRLDNEPLTDVRTERHAALVSSVLHDRVRVLRRSLPGHIRLVGSLAGGRKTVSAALQTAFCLQARAEDRLVHVLLEPRMEAHLRQAGRLREFVKPSAAWEAESGVPVEQQVVVYDAPFPRVRYLLARRLGSVLDEMPWDEVWPLLDSNLACCAKAVLDRTGFQRWNYDIADMDTGRSLYSKPLGCRAGAILAALASAPAHASAASLVAWLDEHNVGWSPPSERGSDSVTRANSVRSAVTFLRKELEDIPVGLEQFCPPAQGFDLPHVEARWELSQAPFSGNENAPASTPRHHG